MSKRFTVVENKTMCLGDYYLLSEYLSLGTFDLFINSEQANCRIAFSDPKDIVDEFKLDQRSLAMTTLSGVYRVIPYSAAKVITGIEAFHVLILPSD